MALLKTYPDLASGQLVREKLSAHLARENLEGELAYFRAAGGAQRPYGYAWFLRLYAELATWKDPDGARYAENATPLARFFSDGIVSYLVDLERPNRMGNQTNSALTLNLLLDYVEATRDMTIKRAVGDAARRLYQTDTKCATGTEAATPEMVSPCLEEAAVMSRVLDPAAFLPWFDQFLASPESAAFKTPLRSISFDAVPVAAGRGPRARRSHLAGAGKAARPAAPSGPPSRGARIGRPGDRSGWRGFGGPRGTDGSGPQTNPRATWIGLAFTRASAYSHLAATLPAGDPRIAVFRRLSDLHAEQGQEEVVTPRAFDAPWVGARAPAVISAVDGRRTMIGRLTLAAPLAALLVVSAGARESDRSAVLAKLPAASPPRLEPGPGSVARRDARLCRVSTIRRRSPQPGHICGRRPIVRPMTIRRRSPSTDASTGTRPSIPRGRSSGC